MNTTQLPDRFDGWLESELKRQLSTITPANIRPAQARYQALALNRSGGLFAITKLKVAVAVAAGALAIGAAGAYAANTVTVQNPKSFPLGSGANTVNLIAVNGQTITTTPKWTTVGECVSFFAENRNYALAPSGTLPSSLTLFKNYHGKLVSFATSWCKTQVTVTAGSTTTGTKGDGNSQGQNNGNQGQNNNGQGQGNKGQGQGNGGSPGKGHQGQGNNSQGH